MEDRQGKLQVRLLVPGRRLLSCLLAGALCAGTLLVSTHAQGATQAADAQSGSGIPVAPKVEGTATGTLVLNGARVTLTHAYADARPGTFDKAKEDTRVLLSNVPLSDEAREDVFELMKMAREGKAQAIELLIDESGQVISGAFYAKAFDGMISATGMHKFEPERREARAVSGRLWTEGPHTFMKVTYEYDVRFAAPIPRPPTAAEVKAALASPPAKAAAAYVAALRKGDTAAFIATLTKQAAADYAGPDGAARLQQLRAEMPADTRVAAVEAAKPPDTAILVTVEGHQDGVAVAYILKMRAIDGAWKVDK